MKNKEKSGIKHKRLHGLMYKFRMAVSGKRMFSGKSREKK